jgi:hypothetical protein
MNSALLIFFVQRIAAWTIGTGVFQRIVAAVDEWAQKEIDGLHKKTGVVNQLKAEGLFLTDKAFNRGIELALIYIESKVK